MVLILIITRMIYYTSYVRTTARLIFCVCVCVCVCVCARARARARAYKYYRTCVLLWYHQFATNLKSTQNEMNLIEYSCRD